MTAPTFTAGTTASGDTDALAITVPAVAAGDLLLILVSGGFTETLSSWTQSMTTRVAASGRVLAAARKITGSEGWASGGTQTMSLSGATTVRATPVVVPADEWSGDLDDVVASPGDGSTTFTGTAPNGDSVSGWSGEDWAVLSFISGDGFTSPNVTSGPSGYSEVYADDGVFYIGALYSKTSTAASENPGAWTLSGGGDTGVVETIAIRGYSGPSVETLSPVDEATDVAFNANLVLTFDSNVSAGTGNFVCYRELDDAVLWTIPVGDGQVSIVDDTVTINPTTDFAYATQYYVTAADGILTDWGGIAADEWLFTTEDTPPAPAISALSPAHGSHGNDPDCDLVLTFDENVEIDESTGTITLKERLTGTTVEQWTIDDEDVDITGAVVTVTRSVPLSVAAGSGYYVELEGSPLKSTATDGAAADFTGKETWSFSCFTPTGYQYLSRRWMVPVAE